MDRLRRFYAEEIRAIAGIESDALIDAFARVPRERFLGPGPWQVARMPDGSREGGYRTTPDADPARVLHNVVIAIDPARQLNNGQPSALATWIAALAIAPGDRVAHIGCGTGYYTAIMAELTGRSGRVTAFEIDAEIAARARENLADWPWASAVAGGGGALPESDCILVNAGATHPRDGWLDALAPGGRLVLPLTARVPGMPSGAGVMVRIERHGPAFAAGIVSAVAIYDCEGARDDEENDAILQFLRAAMSAPPRPRSLLRAPHDRGPTCVLHTRRYCLSTDDPR